MPLRTEREMRKYRDALKWAVAQPCTCAGGPGHWKCVMGGKMMQDAIQTLDWVLGDSDDMGNRVERMIAEHLRSTS